jgi:SPP1 family predicted phage head-tail adaptor
MPIPSGARRHAITLQAPGAPVSDGDGGFVQTWADLDPAQVFASIVPATARDLERVAAGTVITTATHLVSMPYHPQLTRETRIRFGTRTLEVADIKNPEERNVELLLICTEQVP